MNEPESLMRKEEQNNALSIDTRYFRIRVHKNAMAFLGYPDYIQILIDPFNRRIAIRPSTEKDHLALRVRDWREYVIRSMSLIQNIQAVAENIREPYTYRVYGKVYGKEKTLWFPLDECVSEKKEKRENGNDGKGRVWEEGCI